MTKNDIIKELMCNVRELDKDMAERAVQSVISSLADSFIRKENVYLRGFGTFQIRHNKEKLARSFSTGTSMMVPENTTVKFKISPLLKERVNLCK